jgi:hypothetical protein
MRAIRPIRMAWYCRSASAVGSSDCRFCLRDGLAHRLGPSAELAFLRSQIWALVQIFLTAGNPLLPGLQRLPVKLAKIT